MSRNKKYPPRKKRDTRIDRNTFWRVYYSSRSGNEVTLNCVQLGSRANLDIVLEDEEYFVVYINGHVCKKYEIAGDIETVEDVCRAIQQISEELVEEGIIRGGIGCGIFEDGRVYFDIQALYFCKECVDVLN